MNYNISSFISRFALLFIICYNDDAILRRLKALFACVVLHYFVRHEIHLHTYQGILQGI